jgi:hypothetical protein
VRLDEKRDIYKVEVVTDGPNKSTSTPSKGFILERLSLTLEGVVEATAGVGAISSLAARVVPADTGHLLQ